MTIHYNKDVHELAVTQGILDLVLQNAESAYATRVTDIHLLIGDLSSIVDDSVQFYWDILANGTICKDARLHFHRIQTRLLCLTCNTKYVLDSELIPCPECGSVNVKILSGNEFQVESIEIETD